MAEQPYDTCPCDLHPVWKTIILVLWIERLVHYATKLYVPQQLHVGKTLCTIVVLLLLYMVLVFHHAANFFYTWKQALYTTLVCITLFVVLRIFNLV